MPQPEPADEYTPEQIAAMTDDEHRRACFKVWKRIWPNSTYTIEDFLRMQKPKAKLEAIETIAAIVKGEDD